MSHVYWPVTHNTRDLASTHPRRSSEPDSSLARQEQSAVRERVSVSARRLLPLLALPTALGAVVPFVANPLWPDMDYYTGGIGLFPSPIGTLLGTLGGYSGVRVLNGLAAFVIVLLVGLVARE